VATAGQNKSDESIPDQETTSCSFTVLRDTLRTPMEDPPSAQADVVTNGSHARAPSLARRKTCSAGNEYGGLSQIALY